MTAWMRLLPIWLLLTSETTDWQDCEDLTQHVKAFILRSPLFIKCHDNWRVLCNNDVQSFNSLVFFNSLELADHTLYFCHWIYNYSWYINIGPESLRERKKPFSDASSVQILFEVSVYCSKAQNSPPKHHETHLPQLWWVYEIQHLSWQIVCR